jgi:hypothetical protein
VGAEPAEVVLQKIMAQYNKWPEGWRVLADPKGNLLVLGPQVGYRLKLIPLSPGEFVGVGINVDPLEEIREASQIPFYGFRPLSNRQAAELLGAVGPNGRIEQKALLKLLGVKPISTLNIKEEATGGLLTGPIITHPDLSAVPLGQKELEMKLSLEADKLFRARHPFRAGIYG